jgi:hypothetical protein
MWVYGDTDYIHKLKGLYSNITPQYMTNLSFYDKNVMYKKQIPSIA